MHYVVRAQFLILLYTFMRVHMVRKDCGLNVWVHSRYYNLSTAADDWAKSWRSWYSQIDSNSNEKLHTYTYVHARIVVATRVNCFGCCVTASQKHYAFVVRIAARSYVFITPPSPLQAFRQAFVHHRDSHNANVATYKRTNVQTYSWKSSFLSPILISECWEHTHPQ